MINRAERNIVKVLGIKILETLLVVLTISFFIAGLSYAITRNTNMLNVSAALGVLDTITFVLGLKLS